MSAISPFSSPGSPMTRVTFSCAACGTRQRVLTVVRPDTGAALCDPCALANVSPTRWAHGPVYPGAVLPESVKLSPSTASGVGSKAGSPTRISDGFHIGTPDRQVADEPGIGSPEFTLPKRGFKAAGDTIDPVAASEFPFKLFRALADHGENMCVSPLASALLLSALRSGADGTTQLQIDLALAFGEQDYSTLLNYIRSLTRPEAASSYDCTIGTALFANTERVAVTPEFRSKAGPGSRCELVDVSGRDAEASVQTIEDWSVLHADSTRPVLSGFLLDEYLRLVVVTASHFAGHWRVPVPMSSVAMLPFLVDGARRQDVRSLRLEGVFRFAHVVEQGVRGVELPYRGRFSLVVFLPDEGQAIRGVNYQEALHYLFYPAKTRRRDCGQLLPLTVSIPTFRLETALNVSRAFADIGVRDIFDPRVAALSGIQRIAPGASAHARAFINAAFAKTTVEVSESRSRPDSPPAESPLAAADQREEPVAAPDPLVRENELLRQRLAELERRHGYVDAATAPLFATLDQAPESPSPIVPRSFAVDAPFAFFVRDTSTGAIAFCGAVINPTTH